MFQDGKLVDPPRDTTPPPAPTPVAPTQRGLATPTSPTTVPVIPPSSSSEYCSTGSKLRGVMHVTAKSSYRLYVNGALTGVEHGQERKVGTYGISTYKLSDSVVVAIESWIPEDAVMKPNGTDRVGILADVTLCNNVYFTNAQWKCSRDPKLKDEKWYLSSYDDSAWASPAVLGQGDVDGIDRNAQWIWTKNSSTGNLQAFGEQARSFCRIKLPGEVGITDSRRR